MRNISHVSMSHRVFTLVACHGTLHFILNKLSSQDYVLLCTHTRDQVVYNNFSHCFLSWSSYFLLLLLIWNHIWIPHLSKPTELYSLFYLDSWLTTSVYLTTSLRHPDPDFSVLLILSIFLYFMLRESYSAISFYANPVDAFFFPTDHILSILSFYLYM